MQRLLFDTGCALVEPQAPGGGLTEESEKSMHNTNLQAPDNCQSTSSPDKASQSEQTADPGRGLKPGPETPRSNDDVREQLYNERKTGKVGEVQVPRERITRHLGILFDLDPRLYLPSNPLFPPDDDPKRFYEKIKPVLDRHPLARSAEVRMTGTGLHAIVRLDPPAELTSDAEQQRWDAVVGAVQCTLPGDPGAPSITALTRAVGSVNSKNGATVEILRSGEPVSPRAVEEFLVRVAVAPFKEIAQVLLGGLRVEPCPVCRAVGSRLDVLDHVGTCYGGCGKVTLDRLLDLVYASLTAGEAREAQADATSAAPGQRDAGGKAKKPRRGKARAPKRAPAATRKRSATSPPAVKQQLQKKKRAHPKPRTTKTKSA
jgi:hypothetical protein